VVPILAAVAKSTALCAYHIIYRTGCNLHMLYLTIYLRGQDKQEKGRKILRWAMQLRVTSFDLFPVNIYASYPVLNVRLGTQEEGRGIWLYVEKCLKDQSQDFVIYLCTK
jgi:hypothetical protein